MGESIDRRRQQSDLATDLANSSNSSGNIKLI